MSRRWIRALAERALLVLLGIILAGVVAEVGLRVAASFASGRARPDESAEGARVILCIGDSHTYGVHTPEAETYPGHLHRLLEKRKAGRYRVLNLGLPGMNSSQVAARFPEWVRSYKPSVAVVLVGLNNIWNDTEMAQGWVRGLRLYRLTRLLAVRFERPEELPSGTGRPEIVRVLREEGAAGEEYHDAATGERLVGHDASILDLSPTADRVERARAQLRQDLEAIAALAAESSVGLIFLTYAPTPGDDPGARFFQMAEISDEIVAVAEELGITVVDVRGRFQALLGPGAPREAYFLTPTEGHPNGRGYREIAAQLVEVIE
jgi:lysophospholipase L1-like esterase